MSLFAAGQDVNAAELNALANSAYTSTTALTGSTTTTSATYVDMATGASLAGFVKAHSSSVLIVFMRKNWFATVANTVGMFGVRVNGVDYDIDNPVNTEANSWQPGGGFVRITGVPAGTYTIQGRWKRTSGTGVLTSGSWFSMLVMEAQ